MRGIALEGVPVVEVDSYVSREQADRYYEENRDAKLARLDAMLDAIHNQGWSSDEHFADYALRRGARSIGAVLRTVDGCCRCIVVPYPPPFDYKVPIAGTISSFNPMATPSLGVRRYRLAKMEHDGVNRRSRVVYEEVL